MTDSFSISYGMTTTMSVYLKQEPSPDPNKHKTGKLPYGFYCVYVAYYLTLILLEQKVISLCHQYRVRPASTSVQSHQALYCWLTNF